MTLTGLARESLELPADERRAFIHREFEAATGRAVSEAGVTAALRAAVRRVSAECVRHAGHGAEPRAGYYVSTQDRPAFVSGLSSDDFDAVFGLMRVERDRETGLAPGPGHAGQ